MLENKLKKLEERSFEMTQQLENMRQEKENNSRLDDSKLGIKTSGNRAK